MDNIFKWLAGLGTSVISGVLIWWLTTGIHSQLQNSNDTSIKQEVSSHNIKQKNLEDIAPIPLNTNNISSDRNDLMLSEFVDNYIECINNKDLSGLLKLYNYQVSYYKCGIVTKDFIVQDKVSFYNKWPEAHYTLKGDISIQKDIQENTYELIFDMKYHVGNAYRRQRIFGDAKTILKVRVSGGLIGIIDEKQVVTNRSRQNY